MNFFKGSNRIKNDYTDMIIQVHPVATFLQPIDDKSTISSYLILLETVEGNPCHTSLYKMSMHGLVLYTCHGISDHTCVAVFSLVKSGTAIALLPSKAK